MIKGARVTDDKTEVPAVVLVNDRRMKDAWCLATSRADLGAADVAKLYGRRFTIEETFRDNKGVHFEMGLSATHIRGVERRDRLLFLGAIAHALLTLLGAAGERCGLDRTLNVVPELADVLGLIAGAAAVLFPVDDLTGKVDLPIVLLGEHRQTTHAVALQAGLLLVRRDSCHAGRTPRCSDDRIR